MPSKYPRFSIILFFLILICLGMTAAGCQPNRAPGAGQAAPAPTGTPVPILGQHDYSTVVVTAPQVEISYLLYLPQSYGKDIHKKWPLILFLHGRGERGDDLSLLKNHPLPKILDQQPDFPFIVISPQLPLKHEPPGPPREYEWWSEKIDALDALLNQVEATYSVDPRRVYLTGISMGGFGAWEYALRYPRRFAAVVPIAGGWLEGSHAVPGSICDLKDVPIWVFHGGMDRIIPPYHSDVLVEALEACGSQVRYTLYPEADHEGAWLQAYADPKLYDWLSAQALN